MSRLGDQRGTALVATLSIAMILLPLGAFVALQCRTDLAILRNLRSEVETFYVAEAGLEHALSDIQPAVAFDDMLLGPDQTAGTADDGVFPFTGGTPADFPYAPFRYDVRITQAANGMLQLLSEGRGQHGTTKTLQALVTRARLPFTPAALYVEGDATGLDLGRGGFLVSGLDHRRTDDATEASGSEAPVAAVAIAGTDAEPFLRNRLSGEAARQLPGAGGSPSVTTSAPLNVEAYARGVANSPTCVTVPAPRLAEAEASLGTPEAPQLSLVAGDLVVSSQLTGNGLLVIRGTLQVTGTFTFTGLVFAMGGVVFEPSSQVQINGTLWRANSTDERTALQGRGALVYSSDALLDVDRAFAGLLPHAVVVVGWREQL